MKNKEITKFKKILIVLGVIIPLAYFILSATTYYYIWYLLNIFFPCEFDRCYNTFDVYFLFWLIIVFIISLSLLIKYFLKNLKIRMVIYYILNITSYLMIFSFIPIFFLVNCPYISHSPEDEIIYMFILPLLILGLIIFNTNKYFIKPKDIILWNNEK